jgi:cardiolipin synthase A/B
MPDSNELLLNLNGIPTLSTAQAIERLSRFPKRFYPAQAVRLLIDGGEAYPEMLGAIGEAGMTVDLESYILAADRTGKVFQQALIGAAKRGVQVRLLYDGVGSWGLGGVFIRELIDAGAAVAVYHPVSWKRPIQTINRRDHHKILVVDGRTSFTGGINIGDDYTAQEEGGRGWRDSHVRIDGGEIAREMTRLFEYAWRRAMPYDYSATRRSRIRYRIRRRLALKSTETGHDAASQSASSWQDEATAVKIIGNEEFRYRRRIHRAYLYAIRQARHYILLENGYFIPTRPVRRALARAVRRGVFVGVVLNYASDVAACTYASRRLYTELLKAGIRLYEWPTGVLHAKTAVIDDAWSIVGSYNFDHRSLVHSLEAVAVVANRDFACRLREQTLADIDRCREITLENHQRRPWQDKFLEWFFYRFRHWL